MLRLLRPRVGLDLLVYTPDEFEQLCRERPFFHKRSFRKARCSMSGMLQQAGQQIVSGTLWP
jgi:hypothetical protein